MVQCRAMPADARDDGGKPKWCNTKQCQLMLEMMVQSWNRALNKEFSLGGGQRLKEPDLVSTTSEKGKLLGFGPQFFRVWHNYFLYFFPIMGAMPPCPPPLWLCPWNHANWSINQLHLTVHWQFNFILTVQFHSSWKSASGRLLQTAPLVLSFSMLSIVLPCGTRESVPAVETQFFFGFSQLEPAAALDIHS